MHDDWVVEKLREAIRRSREEMTQEEWFRLMVERGVLDEQGNVLRRMPEPPRLRDNGHDPDPPTP